MIWLILALLGVPLWLVVGGILALVTRSYRLRARPGNVPVRLHKAGKPPAKGWHRGNAVWVRDVFEFRGSPAAWNELLVGVSSATTRELSPDEAHALRRMDDPVVAVLALGGGPEHGGPVEVAAEATDLALVLGPYGKVPHTLSADVGLR
ncbi:MAG: hypothetical protein GEV08_03310 [Acidimicrobiia bacterium]|nr:hypothetical protein [Acidimicrobiia bacterium]